QRERLHQGAVEKAGSALAREEREDQRVAGAGGGDVEEAQLLRLLAGAHGLARVLEARRLERQLLRAQAHREEPAHRIDLLPGQPAMRASASPTTVSRGAASWGTKPP